MELENAMTIRPNDQPTINLKWLNVITSYRIHSKFVKLIRRIKADYKRTSGKKNEQQKI